jgi:hypothetical protein
MGEKAIVDQRRLVTVAPFRMTGARGGILDHGDFESVLEEFAQVGLDTDVRQHAGENDLGDPSLP